MNAEERKKILAGKGSSVKRSTAAGNAAAAGKARNGKTRHEEPPMTFGESVLSWTKTILSSLLIVMIVNGLLIASFVVPTGSMENEVMAGDFLFVNKFIYGGSTPQTIPFLDTPLPYLRLPGLREPAKSDVIVFIFPGYRDQVKSDEFQYYLKRCVATAGDTLEVRNKAVFINGKEQPKPVNSRFDDTRGVDPGDHLRTFPDGAGFTRDNWGPMRVPKEGDMIPLNDSTFYMWRIFIMREGHQVEKNGQIVSVDGKAATSYKVGRNYCFGMGDNRDNSLDSRYWGFVPVENVVGTPLFVYWSWDPNIPVSSLGDKFGSVRWGRIFKGVN
jgi:signal peptidase I